jgi:putative ABC transport system permease protein
LRPLLHGKRATVTTAEFPKPGNSPPVAIKVVGFTSALIGHGAPQLHARPAELTTDAAAYQSVLNQPGSVLVNQDFAPAGGPVRIGQTITVRDPLTGATHPLTIAGTITQAQYGGFDHAYVSQQTARQIFGAPPALNLLYLTATSGANPDALAATIDGQWLPNGADANTFARLAAQQQSQAQAFLRLVQSYVALGLLVGVAGLGVVMVRAVRERRHHIGVLRALGFARGTVGRAFLTESAFIALEGIIIGAGLATLTTWRLTASGALGTHIPYRIPTLQLTLWLAGAFTASLAATAAPARQAAAVPPAVALRLPE